ncbi:MAG: P-loop NTPase [Haloarculaceae archaeon]
MSDRHPPDDADAPHDDRQTDDAPPADGRPDDRLKGDVEAALRKVRDPDVDRDVFEAGLVEDIAVTDGAVTVVAALDAFRPREGEQVTAAMVRAVSQVEGVEHAHVERAVSGATGGVDRETGLANVDRVVAVASAKGGVGKSTVATHLACALAGDGVGDGERDVDVGVFDADIHGPNVPELLSVSGPVYSDDDGNPLPVETAGVRVMSVGLMESGAPLAWRGAMAHDALTELFGDTVWGDLDTLVVDLPPGTGDVVLTTLQEVHLDGVVVVTTPFHAAVTDTARSLELFRENEVPVLGVVANMAGFTCPSCGDEHALFEGEDPLAHLDAPVLAELGFDPAVQSTPRPGYLPAAMTDLGDSVAERIEDVWSVDVPDGAVDLRGIDAERRHDRVESAFASTEPGEAFVLVSDRDPTPVRSFLATLAEGIEDPGDLDPFEVRRANPETWLVRTERP